MTRQGTLELTWTPDHRIHLGPWHSQKPRMLPIVWIDEKSEPETYAGILILVMSARLSSHCLAELIESQFRHSR